MALDRDPDPAGGGFHSYADDTPREAAPASDARPAAVWDETPVWRRIGEDIGDDHDDAPRPRRSGLRTAAIAGAALGAVAALALGWNITRKPEPQAAAPPRAQAAAAPPATADPPPLEVVLTEPPPPPPLPKTERLEVLPRGVPVGAAAPSPIPRIALAPSRPDVVAQAPPAAAPPPAPAARDAAASAQAANAVERPAPRRFDACDDAPTRAVALVCRDSRLAEADRRMKRAYRDALAAGVPEDMLTADQADWLAVREDAARIGPRAVSDIYRQRTRELQAMADDARY